MTILCQGWMSTYTLSMDDFSYTSRCLVTCSESDIRVGGILPIPAILSELGVRPELAFTRAGVDPALFEDPENHISLDAVGRLLAICVTLTKTNHFGLLVGERFDLNALGPVGYLMRNSPTIGDALHSLLLYLHLRDRGAAPILMSLDPNDSILGYSVYRHDTPGLAQIYDTAIAIAYRIMVELCGPSWKPKRVLFSYSPPGNAAPHQKLFGARVGFDAEVSGIVFDSHWLQRPIEGADPVLHGILVRAIQEAEANSSRSFTEQVRAVLPQMVLSGSVSSNAVASLFGISERTLRRRLQAQQTSLNQLLNEARLELAQQLLDNTRLMVSEISAALQYADPNDFSRAFHNWAGLSPTQWRASENRR